jgi:hypothetical protein
MGGYYEADMLRGKYKTAEAKAKYAELEPMNQAFIKQALGQEQGVAEGRPEDLPGIDYNRPGDVKRKQSRGEHNPYPFSKEEDDDYFRDIFRKKREAAAKAKEQGVSEDIGPQQKAVGQLGATAKVNAGGTILGNPERSQKGLRGKLVGTSESVDPLAHIIKLSK